MSRPQLRRVRVPFGVGQQLATGGSGKLFTGYGCIAYLAVEETTGSATASGAWWDGDSNNGQLITEYTLTAGQSTSEIWMRHQMPIEQGVWYNAASGSISGTMFLWADHLCEEYIEAEHRYFAFMDEALAAAIAQARAGR